MLKYIWLFIMIQISAQSFVCNCLNIIEGIRFKIKVIIFINYKFVKHTVKFLLLRTLFRCLIPVQMFVVFLNNFIHIKSFEAWNSFYDLIIFFFFLVGLLLFHLEGLETSWSTTAYAMNRLVRFLSKAIAAI